MTCSHREPTLLVALGLLFALLITTLVDATGQALGADASKPTPKASSVGYAKIEGPIDRLRERYLTRVVEDAKKQRIERLIVHIDTDGGSVFNAREMFKLVLDQRAEGLEMIAYVDFRAISAGALIAYAHEQLYLAETASIGDIGVIFKTAEGEIKYAPEKIETVIRTLLAQAAEQRGWDRALLMKMTARNQKLYQVRLDAERTEYVIEDDWGQFLAEHPDIDPEDKTKVVLYRGEDRLLTLTGKEAGRLNMASGIARDVDALYEKLDIDPGSVVELTPTRAEEMAWLVTPFAPILAGLAMLLLIFEFKTPGVGIWAMLAAVCGGLFLVSHYFLDLAANLELLLFIGGLVLVAIEVFTFATGGLLAIAGGLMTFVGLVLAFVPNELPVDFSDERFLDALGDAGLSALIAVAIVMFGILAFITWLPRSGLARRVAVAAEVDATSVSPTEARFHALIGQRGTTHEALRPSGLVVVDGDEHPARAKHGHYIDADKAIEVAGVEFGELVVAEVINEDADNPHDTMASNLGANVSEHTP